MPEDNMNYDFEEKERELRGKLERIFDSELMDAIGSMEDSGPEKCRDTILRCLNLLAGIGYLGLGLDNGRNSVELTSGGEVLAGISPSLFLSVEAGVRIPGRLLALYGNQVQREKYLGSLKGGRFLGATALTEETTSIENNPIKTRAVQQGPGYTVSGTKARVTNGPVADFILVAAALKENHAFFLLKRNEEGIELGKGLPCLGYRGTPVCRLSMEKCSIKADAVIGPFKNDEPIRFLRLWEDQILTTGSLGLMKRSYDAAVGYAKSHISGGKPIIAYQEVGFKLAEMLTLFQTSQLLAYRAAWMSDAGEKQAGDVAYCAKVFCTESAEKVASQALQVLGLEGYYSCNPAEESFRDSKYLQVGGTSSEISRMKIADSALGRYI